MNNEFLPESFRKAILGLLPAEADDFFKGLEQQPVTSVRLNPAKPVNVPSSFQVPWCSNGFYLPERPSFTTDPLFQAGCYYVQDASSMFVEQAFMQTLKDNSTPVRVLDLCAAPGGKSTHLLSILPEGSLLIANEVIRSRVPLLTENIEKWGRSNVILTNNDPSDFATLEGFFDVILTDAPCSGEGLFRKDPEAIKEWSEKNVELCSARQQRILNDVWPALKEDGILIYSTCTFNKQENEENIARLLEQVSAESLRLSVPPEWQIAHTENAGVHGYRFYPHKVKGEGFFLSVIQKKESAGQVNIHNRKKQTLSKEFEEVRQLLKTPDDFVLTEKNKMILALPEQVAVIRDFLNGRLNIAASGLAIGEMKHGKLIPHHALALSVDVDPSKIQNAELSHEDALRFLRKEPIAPTGSGMTRFTYHGFGIGWGNVVAGRVNNLLPMGRRILK